MREREWMVGHTAVGPRVRGIVLPCRPAITNVPAPEQLSTVNARRPNACPGGMVWVGFLQPVWQEHRVLSGTVAELFMNHDTVRSSGLYYQ